MVPDPPPAPSTASPAEGASYHLEAYRLLAQMVNNEESAFWTRNQMFLTLNSGLVVILFGILTVLGKDTTTARSQLTGLPSESGSRVLAVPLVAACVMGAHLCSRGRAW